MKIKTKRLPKYLKPRGTVEALYKRLEKKGYHRIGSGAFAVAYAKDDHVIKVAVGDRGYNLWLEYALAHQHNPYFPKIFDVKRFSNVGRNRKVKHGHNVTVVSMERLEEDWVKYHTSRAGERLGWNRSAFKRKHNKLEREVVAAIDACQSRGCFPDIGAHNILFRGKQPVFTDPVA